MLRNYLIIAWRNLWKNKLFSTLNIFGLSLGIGCACLLFLLIKYELSFDKHHPDRERIFRVVQEDTSYGTRTTQAMPYPLPEALRNDFEEIEAVTIVDAVLQDPVVSVSVGNQLERYKESRGVAFVEKEYFEIFPQQWIAGNPETVFSDIKSVVLSQSLAEKYFGKENPLGKVVNFNNQFDLKVIGIIQDPPKNTDMPFQMLISFDLGEEDQRGSERWDATFGPLQCYLKLKNLEDVGYLNGQLETYYGDHWPEDFAKKIRLYLQPLQDLHFDTRFSNFNARVVSEKSIWAMGLIGFFLLITSSINFINLNTVLATRRAKEIGIRKVMGSQRLQLVVQFLGETFLITLLSVIGAMVLVQLGLTQMERLMGYSLDIGVLGTSSIVAILLVIIIAVCLLAGLYPALMMSGFKPVVALSKKITDAKTSSVSLRSSLVVTQLVISQVLVICTLVVASQLNYFQQADLGFEKEAIVEFPLPVRQSDKVALLSNSLANNPYISQVSFSNTGAASDDSWGGDFIYENGSEIIEEFTLVKFIDENFIDTYQIPLKAGTNLLKSDSANMFLVNESFVRSMGLTDSEQAIGEFVLFWGTQAPIAGVLKDFHTSSLHSPIKACIFLVGANRYFRGAAKISGRDMTQALAGIESAWNSVYPGNIFEYQFLDESIANFYQEEAKQSRLLKVFASLSILIGCIGIFALVSFMANQRVKEVGIRKVLGASVSSIVLLLSKYFLLMNLIAFLIAVPLSYHMMKSWLDNFTYRIELGVGLFLVGALVSLLIVGFTVGFRTIKAALTNPVESLKYQ